MVCGTEGSSIATSARASWLCPLSAWVSQAVLSVSLRGVHGLFLLWLIAAFLQLALIVGGLYFAGKVLTVSRSSVPANQWWSAVAGATLSGATILLGLALATASYFHS